METKEIKQMKIFGDIKEVREGIDGVASGKYLYIETTQNNPIYIPYDEFFGLVSEAKTKSRKSVAAGDVKVSESIEELPIEEVKQRPDFSGLMKFLLERTGISFDDENSEIIILSDRGIFLELPWEDIIDRKVFVFRKASSVVNGEERLENNLLILLSHAYKSMEGGVERKMENIERRMNEEAEGTLKLMYSIFVKNQQQSFRVESIFLSKHTTKKLFSSIDLDKFNYLHIILHGLPDGTLCLEDPDKTKYEYSDPISAADFLKTLEGKNFDLIFLSFCFSGGGRDGDEESLALQLVKNGASKSVIGYSYPVGDLSAMSFAKYFYEYLINGGKIDRVYASSLEKYYQSTSTVEYLPLLYMRE